MEDVWTRTPGVHWNRYGKDPTFLKAVYKTASKAIVKASYMAPLYMFSSKFRTALALYLGISYGSGSYRFLTIG